MMLILAMAVAAQEPEARSELDWPRVYENGGDQATVYDPQVDSWDRYEKLKGRSAVAVRPAGSQEEHYGVFEYEMSTETDHETGQVLLKDRTITAIRFSGVRVELGQKLDAILRRILAAQPSIKVSLAFLLAYVEEHAGAVPSVKVNLEPPPIFTSHVPAILVMFLGEPDFKPVTGTSLRFAVNTNWDVLHHPGEGRYFLLHGEGWLATADVRKGPWAAAGMLPKDFYDLPRDDNWSEARKALPGKTIAVPKVVVSLEPSELIVLDGQPVFLPIPGTPLAAVTNTSSDLFRHEGEKVYYFLTAGRWFRAPTLEGPWTAATGTLPDDFAKIPPDHSKAGVRASVPGTPEAADAVLLATVPRKAAVNRKDVSLAVTYDGEPKFEAIGTTGVSYALNSPYSVLKVRDRYYCCHEAVWFESPGPTGPWIVCDKVAPEIYTIPSDHPKYNVTYTHVYSSTPDVVYVGYTAGYTGTYVSGGAVVFGMGMAIAFNHAYWHYHCDSHWYGYGCGASYNYHSGNYYRASSVYGPYGGAGYGAGYNPATGNYVRGAQAYGPYGERHAARSYNPTTGVSKARTGGSTPYGSWERGVAVQGDDWARGGVARDSRGAVAGAETSRGGKALGVENPQGERAGVARTGSGNVYAGKDGEVYRRNEDGWQKNSGGQWNDVSSQRERQAPDTSKVSRDTSQGLQRDAQSRDRGSQAARQTQRSSGGGSRGGGRGGGRGGRR